jgi:type II secretory pathway pseudopilin PulG
MIYSRRQGFTLMEVLVSSALTVVILTMLFTVLIGAMNAWQTGTNRLQGNADARLALDSIAQDLQSMVVRQTSIDQEWLYSERRQIFGLEFERNSTMLLFFSPSLDREPGQQGDIVAIQYQVAFADPLSGNPDGNVTSSNFNLFGLYKRMASTEETFNEALGQSDIFDDYWGLQNRLTPRSRDLLIPNVVELHVAWNINFDANKRIDEELRLGNVLALAPSAPASSKIESADISLTILTDEGMRRVQTLARGNNLSKPTLDNVIREHGRVYTKRVKIQY